MTMYKFRVVYNANFWGSKKASGYIFADTEKEARTKLERKYGKVDYQDLNQSSVVDYEINETDIITL
jgi:DNA-dependent RNA polymerase auxiliary subunit epsilon